MFVLNYGEERERESYGDGGKARAKRMRVSFVPVVVEHK